MTMTDETDFITRKVKTAFLADFICCNCGQFKLSISGKLWDMGAGQYEFICNDCEKEILEESEVD